MRDSLQRLQKLGVPIGSIIDVGVNYSTPALIAAFPQHKHILIEPIADYFPAIHKNYAGMDYQLLEAAASDEDGVVHVASYDKFGGGHVTHSEIVSEAGPNTRQIQSAKLDTLIPATGAKAPYLLKIDVEGAEVPAAILRGAAETLQRASAVVIEMTVPKFMERASVIAAAGFQLFDIADACYYRDALWQVDATFVRNDIIDANPALRPMTDGPFDRRAWRPMTPLWRRAAEKLKARIRLS